MTAAVRLARRATSVLLVAAVVLLATIVLGRAAQWSAAPVLTGSMRPTFAPGDLVVTRPVRVAALRPGDVAVLVPPGHTASYAHRVISVSGEPSAPVVRTKGDANVAPDAWRARLTTPTVQVVAAHVPYVGRLLVVAKTPQSRALLIGLLGLLMTAWAVHLVLTTPTTPRTALS